MQKAAAASVKDYREIGKLHLEECHWSTSGSLFSTTTAWFLVTQMCATERSYALCSGLAQLPTILKADLTRPEVAKGVHRKVRDLEAWTMSIQALEHVVSVLFLIKIHALKCVDFQPQKTKWLLTPGGGQTSTGEWMLPMFFLDVSQIHFDGTTPRRVLKPFTFRTAHRISLFYTLYMQEICQTRPVTTVEAVLWCGYLSPGSRTEDTNSICKSYHAVFRW